MARRKKGRALNGVLLFDKPLGLSSNQALQKVRWLFDAQKAGHTGALDPLATGVLPICFGEATKLSNYLLEADKSYRATVMLGVQTTSGDTDGEIVRSCDASHIDQNAVEQALEAFRGETDQTPSMYSALKHQGQPLYKLARQGIEVERSARKIRIERLELVAFDAPQFTLEVRCSKGTYIRSLAEDLGESLGVGAHLTALRRLSAGVFHIDDCVGLDTLEGGEENRSSDHFAKIDSFLREMDVIVPHLPKVNADFEQSRSLFCGQVVKMPQLELTGLARLHVPAPSGSTSDTLFGGIVEVESDGLVKPKRLFVGVTPFH